MSDWDEYRVGLFKKKIREALPEVKDLRFERSKGRCNLIIPVRWRYYNHVDEVFDLILGRLKEHGIDAEPKQMFSFRHENGPKWDYITIPIDQAALPERKRNRPEMSKR